MESLLYLLMAFQKNHRKHLKEIKLAEQRKADHLFHKREKIMSVLQKHINDRKNKTLNLLIDMIKDSVILKLVFY